MNYKERRLFELKHLIETARMKTIAAQTAESDVFNLLDNICGDTSDTPTHAENADNLMDAIACFIDYGEYSLDGIMNEVKEIYKGKPY